MKASEAVARLCVRVILQTHRRAQRRFGLLPTSQTHEHDAEVMLCARVVAALLCDGLAVGVGRRLRLAQTRQRVPRVVEELRVEPLRRDLRAHEPDGLPALPAPAPHLRHAPPRAAAPATAGGGPAPPAGFTPASPFARSPSPSPLGPPATSATSRA